MDTQNFTDVTLISDDQQQYRVHKFILSACSTVFEKILTNSPSNSSIYLRGIHHEELESILQFIYLGEATFFHERMNEFLNVAKDLDIKEIGKYVIDEDKESEILDNTQSYEEEDQVESHDNNQHNNLTKSSASITQGNDSDSAYIQINGEKKSYRRSHKII